MAGKNQARSMDHDTKKSEAALARRKAELVAWKCKRKAKMDAKRTSATILKACGVKRSCLPGDVLRRIAQKKMAQA